MEYRDEHWEQAIARFSALIEKKAWNAADRKKYLPDSYLNRACCRARGLTGSSSGTEFDPIFSDCKEGLKVALDLGELAGFRPRLQKELETTGDLGMLALQFPDRVRELLA